MPFELLECLDNYNVYGTSGYIKCTFKNKFKYTTYIIGSTHIHTQVCMHIGIYVYPFVCTTYLYDDNQYDKD